MQIQAGRIASTFATLAMLPVAAHAESSETESPVIVIGHSTQPPELESDLGKTGTPLADLPRSVQVVSNETLDAQGAVRLTDALSNVSSAAQGGQFAFGFYDRVTIRGLNTSFSTDGLLDASSELGGIPHSLLGVERVEVLKGPGSALLGTSPQGGVINLVHFRPSETSKAGFTAQTESFDGVLATAYISGPIGISGLSARLDAGYRVTDGFRNAGQRIAEFLPALRYKTGGHDFNARVEIRHIETTPDASGIPFSAPGGVGLPAPVSRDTTYYTPYALGNQDIKRILLSDSWELSDAVTINNRYSHTHRDVDVLRNSGGTVALLSGVNGLRSRTLRQQQDRIDDNIYQFEPVFRFATAGISHTLLTGFQAKWVSGHVKRSTADLPNVPDLLNPVISDPVRSALTFKCDATHSCADADISARFYSVYAIDQLNLADRLKLRFSARHDWDRTQGTATSVIPANAGMQKPCSPPQTGECPWAVGVPNVRKDKLWSWDVGAVWTIVPSLSLFGGVQNSRYPIFNTEEPQSIGGAPEGGRQVEAGIRFAAKGVTLSAAAFDVRRDSVATVLFNPLTGFDEPTTFSYRVRGLEGDLNLSLVEGWQVIANVSYQEPKISSFPQTPANVGKLVPSVSKVLANAWTSYEIPVSADGEKLRITAGLRYRSRAFADAANTRILPASTLTDASIAWLHDKLQVSVGVKNLFDVANWHGAAGAGGGALPGPGRTWFARLQLDY